MALETASYVANLVVSNPDGGDQRSTADDHIRLIKAALVRTFPKVDGAISLSQAQVMYLGDLSASVQLQLNQLRDGSATANFAIASRYANSASVAANIGTIPAARVPDLNATNIFTNTEPMRVKNDAGFISFYNTAGDTRRGYLLYRSTDTILNVEGTVPFLLYVNGTERFRINADGTIVASGAITGTISNATNATNATVAATATTATTATTAAFATSAGSSALLAGLAPSDTGGSNTIVQRNSSGYVFGAYFNQSSSNDENPTPSQVMVTNGTDNYLRKSSVANLGANMAAQNITGRTGTAKTLSPSSPSGGSNGDIWYQY